MLMTSKTSVSSMSVVKESVTSRCKAREVTDDDNDDDGPRDTLLDEDDEHADFHDDRHNGM